MIAFPIAVMIAFAMLVWLRPNPELVEATPPNGAEIIDFAEHRQKRAA